MQQLTGNYTKTANYISVMSKKKIYKHPIYGDGLAPLDCIQKIKLPDWWQRGAIRRFELQCKDAGLFYSKQGHTIMLAFESKEEKESNIGLFTAQLEANGEPFKIK